jgi:hypothetical protein
MAIFNILINLVDDPSNVDAFLEPDGVTLSRGEIFIPIFGISSILINIVDDPINVNAFSEPDDVTLSRGEIFIPIFAIFRILMNIACNESELATSSVCLEAEAEQQLETRALALLRQCTLKPNAVWTSSLQWQAIAQVYQREEDVIAITATGSGKTMIAVLPTLLGADNELALILLPLNSLITDYKRKFTAMNIPFDVYDHHTTSITPGTKFLFISTDLTMSCNWPEFLAMLTDRYDVARLIFDESHIPMISTDYRKVMTILDQLRIIPMQIVLLTGTCPPSSEARMMELFGLEPATTVIFRGRTDRPELQYIRKMPCTTMDQALKQLHNTIAVHKYTTDTSARSMVFVPYLDTGRVAAQYLKCDFYHSQPTDQDPNHNDYLQQIKLKEDMYTHWYKGARPDGTRDDIIVATTALSAGNDYPSVRLVAHLNTPIEMSSYVQEVSRGGRDGKPTQCILIPINTSSPTHKGPGEDYKGLQAMHQYVFEENNCLRYAITSYCDGVGVYCYSDPKRQKCSLCAAKTIAQRQTQIRDKPLFVPTTPNKLSLKRKRRGPGDGSAFLALSETARNRRATHAQNKIEYVLHFNRALAIFNSSCAYCLVKKQTPEAHNLTSCPEMKPLWSSYREWKHSFNYPKKFPNKSCFFCHIPCVADLLHPEVGKSSDCIYPDIVPVVAFRISLDAKLKSAGENHFRTSWKTTYDYSRWLIQVPKDGSPTHISALFLWYTKMYFDI